MKRLTMLGVVLAAAILPLLHACGENEQLRLGFLAELTGSSADMGEAGRNGVMLAVDHARESGVLQGRTVEIVVRDSGSTAGSAKVAAEEMVNIRVDAIIGPMTSGIADAVLPVAEKSQTLLVSPSASAFKFYGKDDWMFRINWTTRDNGQHYAKHYHGKGIHRLAVALNENNRIFAESWMGEFRRAYEALGGQIETSAYFDSQSANFSDIVSKLLDAQPDGLLFIGNALDSARLAQQTRKLNARIPMIAAEWAATDQLIETGGKAVEGLMTVLNYNQEDTSPHFQEFRDTYIKRFGKPPVFGSVLAYDGAMVTLTALSKRPRGMSAKEALLKFGPYQGLQQTIRFDANGDADRVAYFMVIRDGRFTSEP